MMRMEIALILVLVFVAFIYFALAPRDKSPNKKGVENLKRVIKFSTERALILKKQDLKSEIFVRKCRQYAITRVVEIDGKDEQYKSTIVSQITRDIGINSVKDIDAALMALWRGESHPALEIISSKVGELDDVIIANIEKINKLLMNTSK